MDAKDYIQRQFASVRRLTDSVIRDTTDEQLNWPPPGTCNSIGATFVHFLTGEDRFIQNVIQGKPMLLESEGWSEKLGLTLSPDPRRRWEAFRSARLALEPLLGYQQAVRAATDGYLARLTPEELERPVTIFDGPRPVADVLALLVVHIMGHTGEIAAMKGVQGVKGLPF